MFKKLGINLAIALITGVFKNKVKDLKVKSYLLKRMAEIEKVGSILTDADPNNSDQLTDLWEENWELLLDDSILTVLPMIAKSKANGDIKRLTVQLLADIAKTDFSGTDPENFSLFVDDYVEKLDFTENEKARKPRAKKEVTADGVIVAATWKTVETAEKPKRKRRTKAEMEAEKEG